MLSIILPMFYNMQFHKFLHWYFIEEFLFLTIISFRQDWIKVRKLCSPLGFFMGFVFFLFISEVSNKNISQQQFRPKIFQQIWSTKQFINFYSDGVKHKESKRILQGHNNSVLNGTLFISHSFQQFYLQLNVFDKTREVKKCYKLLECKNRLSRKLSSSNSPFLFGK